MDFFRGKKPEAKSEPQQLWVVGQDTWKTGAWNFVGVFDDVDVAVAHCLDNMHWVGPIKLNEADHEPLHSWEGLWYPKR